MSNHTSKIIAIVIAIFFFVIFCCCSTFFMMIYLGRSSFNNQSFGRYCNFENNFYSDGESFANKCNTCFCDNGRVTCTNVRCDIQSN